MKLLASALAVAALGLPAARASSLATMPALVYTPGYGNSIVSRIDPLTLARSGPMVRLGGNASSWSYSPQGRYVAIASYPQRLTVIDVPAMRVVARVRLAAGGGVARALTWTRRDQVVAVVETPRGALVVAVDPLAGRLVRSTQLRRPFAFALDRLPDGLVFLLDARNRIAPVQVAVVDADGRVRVGTVSQATIGTAVRASGRFERRSPGLAVDPAGRKAYVVDGERVFVLDLDTFAVADRGPLRQLAKVTAGSVRTARWLGGGLLAVSGTDWGGNADTGHVGLRLVDVRDWTVRVVDRAALSFTMAAERLLVADPDNRRAVILTAYGFDGSERYRVELAGATWLKTQGRLGYACRYAYVRTVFDLGSGRVLRSGFPAGTRCPTVLAGDSRG